MHPTAFTTRLMALRMLGFASFIPALSLFMRLRSAQVSTEYVSNLLIAIGDD